MTLAALGSSKGLCSYDLGSARIIEGAFAFMISAVLDHPALAPLEPCCAYGACAAGGPARAKLVVAYIVCLMHGCAFMASSYFATYLYTV